MSALSCVRQASPLLTIPTPMRAILRCPALSRPAMALRPRRAGAPVAASADAAAAASSAAKDDVKGDMLEPSTANKPLVRFLALAATVAIGARSTGFLSTAGIGFVHMLAYGIWLGTLSWTSFIFGIVAFRNLPRQTFGKLQSKLFPLYFALGAACGGVLLGTLHFATGGAGPAKQLWLLGIGLAGSLGNLLVAEPAATDVMFQRYELENATGPRDEAAIKALSKQFGKWHGISSLLNLAVLVCVIGHGYYLGAHLTLGA